MQGKNARMYPTTSYYPHEPWLLKSLNTSSSFFTQVGCQGSIVASTPKL